MFGKGTKEEKDFVLKQLKFLNTSLQVKDSATHKMVELKDENAQKLLKKLEDEDAKRNKV